MKFASSLLLAILAGLGVVAAGEAGTVSSLRSGRRLPSATGVQINKDKEEYTLFSGGPPQTRDCSVSFEEKEKNEFVDYTCKFDNAPGPLSGKTYIHLPCEITDESGNVLGTTKTTFRIKDDKSGKVTCRL